MSFWFLFCLKIDVLRINNFSISKTFTCLIFFMIACHANGQYAVDVLNKGAPGNSSSDLLHRVEEDVLSEHPDVCVILVGTNDLLNTSKMVALSNYIHNIRSLADRTIRAGIKTILVSPPPVDTVYLFQRHDQFRYSQPPNQLLKMANDSLAMICELENIPFIDLYKDLRNKNTPQHKKDMIIQNEWNMQVPDGVHFTAQGNELLATLVMNYLVELKYLCSSVRIVCFGDSLTYGVRMNGAGTTTGDTYPAYLKNQIINWNKENK